MGNAKFGSDKVKDGDQVDGRTEASGLSFDGAEDADEFVHDRVGQAPFPVLQDSLQMALNHLGQLHNELHV